MYAELELVSNNTCLIRTFMRLEYAKLYYIISKS